MLPTHGSIYPSRPRGDPAITAPPVLNQRRMDEPATWDQLANGRVHLWLVDMDAVDRALIPDYLALMTEGERERNRRYRFESGRFADCITRALVRTVLSRYTGIAPTAWRFDKGIHGKPEIAAPLSESRLRFNLSHSRRYVVCAVGLDGDLGVDVECTERNNPVLEIAHRYFSSREVKDLFALPLDCRHSRFFDYWTLKEAYLKARGEGISLGLGNFSFRISDDREIGIGFSECLNDWPEDWRFRLLSPAADHRMAVALRTGRAADMHLRIFETVPLRAGYTERTPG